MPRAHPTWWSFGVEAMPFAPQRHVDPRTRRRFGLSVEASRGRPHRTGAVAGRKQLGDQPTDEREERRCLCRENEMLRRRR